MTHGGLINFVANMFYSNKNLVDVLKSSFATYRLAQRVSLEAHSTSYVIVTLFSARKEILSLFLVQSFFEKPHLVN